MRITRRWGEPVALGALLAVLAVLTNSTAFLLGTIVLGGYLLTTQLAFVSRVQSLNTSLSVEQDVSRRMVTTDTPTTFTLQVVASELADLSATVTTRLAQTTTIESGSALTVTAAANETVTESATCTWPVAGIQRCQSPRVSVSDSRGWYETRFPAGNELEIHVRPRRIRSMHIGQSGTALATGYGEHESRRTGSGITPAELRQYLPGDTISQIDWKATARLGEVFVRDFEAETDLQTMLIIDHRSSLSQQADTVSKLEYLRTFGLTAVDQASEITDPLGLVSVDDGGITNYVTPGTTPDHYEQIRSRIRQLQTRPGVDEQTSIPGSVSPESIRSLVTRLDGEDAFATQLRPFLARQPQYVERIRDRPLFAATRFIRKRGGHRHLCVLLTDDRNRSEVREAVKLAASGDGQVLVFLTPSILFAPGGLADLEAAYHAYVDFESFRSGLDAIEGVRAFEIAPTDRLQAVLSPEARRAPA